MNYSDVDAKENAFALGMLPRTWIAGWIIVGTFCGIIGFLAAFLVEKGGPRMKRALVCVAIGLVLSFLLAALFAFLIMPALVTAMAPSLMEQAMYSVDYVGN